MNSLLPFFSTNRPYDEVLSWLKQQLSHAGLRVMQTFDLRLTASLKLGNCACPHHGTDTCDCQMIVLLIYGNAPEPATLILHGNDGLSWLSLIDRPGQQADVKTVNAIHQALGIQASAGI
ncbi:MAG: hypothetical protein HYR70_08275 [Chloroflexi bacterium]|nr:hypothetical protein [Chloroflexota bacterium]MBI3339173.1 hypothetical protein [Chloroflexota bacterium]